MPAGTAPAFIVSPVRAPKDATAGVLHRDAGMKAMT